MYFPRNADTSKFSECAPSIDVSIPCSWCVFLSTCFNTIIVYLTGTNLTGTWACNQYGETLDKCVYERKRGQINLCSHSKVMSRRSIWSLTLAHDVWCTCIRAYQEGIYHVHEWYSAIILVLRKSLRNIRYAMRIFTSRFQITIV